MVIESGASRMTLDAVAAKAGISKGGLLYNFPTKEALLEAMLARRIKIREELQNEICKNLPPGPARFVKGYMLSSIMRDQGKNRLGATLLANLAHNPRLVEPVREIVRQLYTGFVSPEVKFEKLAIVALAADGLLLQDILSVSPLTEEQRKKIVDELLRLADEATAPES